SFASPLDIDVVAVRDFEDREPERRIDFASRPIPLDKSHLRHSCDLLGCRDARCQILGQHGGRQCTLFATDRFWPQNAEKYQTGFGRTALHASRCTFMSNDDSMRYWAGEYPLGAQPRSLDEVLPFGNRCLRGRDRQIELEPLAIAQHDGVAADRDGNLRLRTADIDAHRGTRSIRIGRRAVGLLNLKEFHSVTNAVSA